MQNEDKQGDGAGTATVPRPVMGRGRLVLTGDGSEIVVVPWSIPKFLEIMRIASEALAEFADVPVEGSKALTTGQKITMIIERLGEGALMAIVRESVRPEDREKVATLNLEQGLELIDQIVDVNLTEGVIKKVGALAAKIKARLGIGSTGR